MKSSTAMSIWIGFDEREVAAFAVAFSSIRRRLTVPIPINSLVLDHLREKGLYWRPTEKRGSQLWDVISDAPMSTEFAISRFLVPHLAKTGWALFTDSDVMALGNVARLFASADKTKAVMCVKHKHTPPPNAVKMDGQAQVPYARKNWSSVMLFNCDHPANKELTPKLVNTLPGRDLHRFCWLDDNLIGDLTPDWNYLVGLSKSKDPQLVHFTEGFPQMPGYEDQPYAKKWRRELKAWASKP